MYADQMTESMEEAISETERRREIQLAYNKEHGIDPQPLRKKIADILDQVYENADSEEPPSVASDTAVAEKPDVSMMASDQVQALIDDLTQQMGAAARELKFELAGRLRDEIADLRRELRGMKDTGN